MSRLIDMTGKRYGRYTVIKRVDKNDNKGWWLCRCDCGKEKVVHGHLLRIGSTKSCGCYSIDNAKKNFTTHGLTQTKLYSVHRTMVARCQNPKNNSYKTYGAKGIKVCEEWLGEKGFINFYNWAMQNGFKDGLSIDRIDNNKGYSPDNCRWATTEQQSLNKKTNVFLEYQGQTKTLKEWSNVFDIPYKTLHARINRNWDLEKAFNEPVRKVRK